MAPAPTAKTTPTSATETSTPARSGPIRVPRLSTVDEAPFEPISSCVFRASEGSNACMAGRTSVTASPTTAESAKIAGRFSPAKKATADPASAAAPISAITARKRSRLKWSPNEAAKGATSAAGSRRTSPAIPTAAVPPELYAKTPSATKCAHSAVIAAPQASSRRRMFRLRKTATRPASA